MRQHVSRWRGTIEKIITPVIYGDIEDDDVQEVVDELFEMVQDAYKAGEVTERKYPRTEGS